MHPACPGLSCTRFFLNKINSHPRTFQAIADPDQRVHYKYAGFAVLETTAHSSKTKTHLSLLNSLKLLPLRSEILPYSYTPTPLQLYSFLPSDLHFFITVRS